MVQCLPSIATLTERIGAGTSLGAEVMTLNVRHWFVPKMHPLVESFTTDLLSGGLIIGLLPCKSCGLIFLANEFEFSITGAKRDVVTVDK